MHEYEDQERQDIEQHPNSNPHQKDDENLMQ